MDQQKIPIKIAEISINKFNDQIQHKVSQLKTFRISNSSATTSLSDLEKLRKDAINCLRVVKQLKQLLMEIENLKIRTKPEDHEKFDELTEKRKHEALREIQLYQDMKPIEKFNELSHHATSNLDESNQHETIGDPLQIQLQIDDGEIRRKEIESRQALLREFENLQSECVAVSQLFKNVNELVVEQAPAVDKIEENVEVASIEVEEGTKHLQNALSYKTTMYPLVGGLVGAALLGPLGLVAGLKAGSAASLCGGICGYAGGKILKKANTPTSPEATDLPEQQIDEALENSQQAIAR